MMSILFKRWPTHLAFAIDKERYQSELEKLVHQKELLLVEIDHRVKNSLALVSGLLSMQERAGRVSRGKGGVGCGIGAVDEHRQGS